MVNKNELGMLRCLAMPILRKKLNFLENLTVGSSLVMAIFHVCVPCPFHHRIILDTYTKEIFADSLGKDSKNHIIRAILRYLIVNNTLLKINRGLQYLWWIYLFPFQTEKYNQKAQMYCNTGKSVVDHLKNTGLVFYNH